MEIDTSKLTDVDIYKLILQGKLKRFPNQFWAKPGALISAKEITQYFIEDYLNWDEEQIKENLTEMIFRENKLSGMLEYVFTRSPYKALNNAYPGKYNEWELKHVPRNLWEDENKREEAIRWLLIRTNKDKFNELTNLDFLNNGLGGLMDYLIKKKECANINTSKIEEGLSSTKRILKVTFNKSGGTSSRNGITTRVTLPTSWIKELGITEENREVVATLQNNKIIIEKREV